MKIFHVVLLKTRERLDPAEISAIAGEWRRLILSVPGVESARIGPLVSPDPRGFSHMAHIVSSSPGAAAAFGPHADHLATMPLLEDKVTEFLIADLHDRD